MPVKIRTIQTAVPATQLAQDEIRDVFASQPNLSRLGERLIATSFNSAAISTRYSCVDEFDLTLPQPEQPMFYDRAAGLLLSPSTEHPNKVFNGRAATVTT